MVSSATRDVTNRRDAVEYRRLVVQHYGVLWRCARRLASDEQEAADILHDALIVILCHQTGPNDMARFASWCRGVIKFVARRARQRRHSRQAFSLDEGCEHLIEAGEDLETRCLQRDLLRRKLKRVDERGAELLERKFWFGESSEEIAADSERSAAAVRMQLKRVLDACGEKSGNTKDSSVNR